MTLGERLRELRRAQGWTLREQGERAALSVGYLSDLERGRTNPSLQALSRIAGVYDMLPGTILAGTDGARVLPEEELACGLAELVERGSIDQATAQDLSRIELHGHRLQKAEEWLELYYHLRTLMRPYFIHERGD